VPAVRPTRLPACLPSPNPLLPPKRWVSMGKRVARLQRSHRKAPADRLESGNVKARVITAETREKYCLGCASV
jgi:hypothetical protein